MRELDKALATLPGIVAQKAPGFEEKDMRAILFTEFRCVFVCFPVTCFSRVSHVFLTCFSLPRETRMPGDVNPELWSLLETLAACALSQRGSAADEVEQSFMMVLDLANIHLGTQGWRYFLHKELEASRAVDDVEFDSRPLLADKRPEAVSTMRASMAVSLRGSMAVSAAGSHHSFKSLGNAALFMSAAGMEAHPPEAVCQKQKPTLGIWLERKIMIDGKSLNVFEEDADTGKWEVKPRGSSISDLTPDTVTGQRCTVVQSDTKFWCDFSSLFLALFRHFFSHCFVTFSRTFSSFFLALCV